MTGELVPHCFTRNLVQVSFDCRLSKDRWDAVWLLKSGSYYLGREVKASEDPSYARGRLESRR